MPFYVVRKMYVLYMNVLDFSQTQNYPVLTLPKLSYFRREHKDATKLENHLNPVMLVLVR